MNPILNIAGYKFIELSSLAELQAGLLEHAAALQIKGTILLSQEGINMSLAGEQDKMAEFLAELQADTRFADMTFRRSYSASQPFRYLKVKLKKEIITLRQPGVHPEHQTAPSISPQRFQQWLDENRDVTVLDTRNDYEVQFGTFRNAVNLHLKDFGEFPQAIDQVPRDKPIVMFCTGGVRCEKAAWVMLNAGFSEVYQLEGGILNYFAETGGKHYEGECFVFDERIALDVKLQPAGTEQCSVCQGPIKKPATCC